MQCSVITSRAGEPRGNDHDGDNRRATSDERDHGRRTNDNRRGDGHTRGNRRAPDDEDDDGRESSLGDSGRRRERIRVSQAAWNRAKEAVLGRYVISRDAPYEEWLCYQKLLSQQQEQIRREKISSDAKLQPTRRASEGRNSHPCIHPLPETP